MHIAMKTGDIIVQVQFRQQYFWDFMGVASLVYLEDILFQKTSWTFQA